eukprot:1143724-Pelagomonas_calceolata.AAC.4
MNSHTTHTRWAACAGLPGPEPGQRSLRGKRKQPPHLKRTQGGRPARGFQSQSDGTSWMQTLALEHLGLQADLPAHTLHRTPRIHVAAALIKGGEHNTPTAKQ